VTVGMPVTIRFPTQDMCVCKGRITEIGSVAGKANAFPVKAVLSEPPKTVRSGMTTEVAILLETKALSAGYMVPLAAIAPGKKEREGFVFVFDEKSSTVKKIAVKAKGVQENMVALDGLKPGSIIAIAGVNFLVDGQKVKLFSP
ncbi:MAG: efflux RND transporter periplasmic adaptor subunit, partial [Gammaproteobacteria bacterium]|nr:efflux RND transporter periplasmic adaptor subunit [Gammaproteobacteria bacterium]